jgi:hypothetical protein
MVGRVAVAGGGAGPEDVVERVLGIGGDMQPSRGGVFLEAMDMARPGDRHDEPPARQYPGQRQLGRGAALSRGMRLPRLRVRFAP